MKLVYVEEKPYWMTPEGRFIDAASSGQQYGGIYLKTPEGLFPMGEQRPLA